MEVFHDHFDSTFSFMHVDRDGNIRMDPSSPYAMVGLVALTEKFGAPVYARIDAPASMEQKAILKNLVAEDVKEETLAG